MIRVSNFCCVQMFDCMKNTRVSRETRADSAQLACLITMTIDSSPPSHYSFRRLCILPSLCARVGVWCGGSSSLSNLNNRLLCVFVSGCVGGWKREEIKNPTLFECLRFVRQKPSSGPRGYVYNGGEEFSKQYTTHPPVIVVSDA